MEYCLICDDDGHWFVCPLGKEKLVDEFFEKVYSGVFVDKPNWLIDVGGSPSLVVFKEYRLT